MKRIWRNICCCLASPSKRNLPPRINVLILGLVGSGKTEIGHVLAAQKRTDFISTNGARTFHRRLGPYRATFIEIGGNDDIRNIWHHYYAKAMGVIYVVDVTSTATLRKSCTILTDVIKHRFVQGKPIVVVANKSDLHHNTVNILDLYDDFSLEYLANFYHSHIKLESCGQNDYIDLFNGIEWLHNRILADLKRLKNRIKFDVETERSELSGRDFRPHQRIGTTVVNQLRNYLYRPKSAPTTVRPSRNWYKTRTNRIHCKTAAERTREGRLHGAVEHAQ